jgi:hypothetical protein
MRLRVMLVILSITLSGCGRANQPDPPPVFGRYLQALQSKDYAKAYRLTELPQSQGGSGFALTREHFAAFFEAHPLKSYDVVKVTKLEQRRLEGSQQVGAPPIYVVDMKLTYADGVRSETWHIEGDVVGVLQLEAAPIALRARRAVTSITVDGVPTPVDAGGEGASKSYYLTVLNGIHQISFAGTMIEVLTQPLSVRSGSATIEDGVVVLNLG